VPASVTIVIPTRDRAELLLRAIASVKAQTHPVAEIIAVDDGSVIPVTGIPGVRHIRNDVPRGVCAARNQGLAATTGEWIAFLDDDDELMPRFVEASLSRAMSSHLAAPVSVHSTIEVVDPSGQRRELRHPVTVPRRQSFFASDDEHPYFAFANSLFMPVAVLRKINGWDERLRAWEVEDFFIRLTQASSIDAIEEVCYRLHDHQGPHLGADDAAMVSGALLTMRTHAADFEMHTERLARYQAAIGFIHLRNGRVTDALRALGSSFRLQPRFPRRPFAWLVASWAYLVHAASQVAHDLIDKV